MRARAFLIVRSTCLEEIEESSGCSQPDGYEHFLVGKPALSAAHRRLEALGARNGPRPVMQPQLAPGLVLEQVTLALLECGTRSVKP